MGCNCKRTMELEDANSVKMDVTILDKIVQIFRKIILAFIVVAMTMVVTPVTVLWLLYSAFLNKGVVRAPKRITELLMKSMPKKEKAQVHG